jgi:hypothetical protein
MTYAEMFAVLPLKLIHTVLTFAGILFLQFYNDTQMFLQRNKMAMQICKKESETQIDTDTPRTFRALQKKYDSYS